jgi:hypothetical protein
MTNAPKEVNKVAAKINKEKTPRSPVKSLADLNVVKKDLKKTQKHNAALTQGVKKILKANDALKKLLAPTKAK